MLTVLAWLVALIAAVLVLVVLYLVVTTRRIAAKAERDIPMVGSTVMIGGDRIRYLERGEGRPIVFVHGLGGQLHHFEQTLFPAIGDGFRVIALDRPGSGYSTRVSSGPRIPEQADVIAGFIDALGLDRPLVVGHSLGGAISLALALRHPHKIAGLALISPLTRFVPRPPAAFGGLYIASPLKRWIIARTIAVPMALKMAKPTLDFIFAPQAPTPDYAIGGGGYLGLRPSHFYAVSSDLVAVEQDLPAQNERYGEIAMPVCVLYGDSDKVLDHAEQGLSLKPAVLGVDIELLAGIGHMPQFVVPRETADFVRRAAARAFAA
jgi:pimeloyl-ACP methyl ester carboxylesterase